MGTLTAPILRIARSVIDHSGRFSESRATRSPALIPRDARPSATWRTRSANSGAVMLIHSPPTLLLNASDLLCFSEALRHKLGTEDRVGAAGWLGVSIVARAAEANF